jgi:hypothetical protein
VAASCFCFSLAATFPQVHGLQAEAALAREFATAVRFDVGVAGAQRDATGAVSQVTALIALEPSFVNVLDTVHHVRGWLDAVDGHAVGIVTAIEGLRAARVSVPLCDSLGTAMAAPSMAAPLLATPSLTSSTLSLRAITVVPAVAAVALAFNLSDGDVFCEPCAVSALASLASTLALAESSVASAVALSVAVPTLNASLHSALAVSRAQEVFLSKLSHVASAVEGLTTSGLQLSPADTQQVLGLVDTVSSAMNSLQGSTARLMSVSAKARRIADAANGTLEFVSHVAGVTNNGLGDLGLILNSLVAYGDTLSDFLGSAEVDTFLTFINSGADSILSVIQAGVGNLRDFLAVISDGLAGAG